MLLKGVGQVGAVHCRANVAHGRELSPDSVLGIQGEALKNNSVVPTSLRRGGGLQSFPQVSASSRSRFCKLEKRNYVQSQVS